jgi:hypothetical protein
MTIAGTTFSSPPDALLAWNEEQKLKMVSESAKESGATEAQAEVQCPILSTRLYVGGYLCSAVSSIVVIIQHGVATTIVTE